MAAHGDGGGIGVGVVHQETGDVFEKFADVAIGDLAEGVGGNGGHEVVGAFLFVDLGGVALDLAGDDEGAEFINAGGEREILRGAFARNDREGLFLAVEAGVTDHRRVGAGSDVEQGVGSVTVGERTESGALERDLGFTEVLSGGLIGNAAGDGAGGWALSEGRRTERSDGKGQ